MEDYDQLVQEKASLALELDENKLAHHKEMLNLQRDLDEALKKYH